MASKRSEAAKRDAAAKAAANKKNDAASRKAERIFDEVLALERRGDNYEAQEKCKQVLELQPDHANALYMLGRLQQNCFFVGDLEHSGSFSEIETNLTKSVERGCQPALLALSRLLFFSIDRDFTTNPAHYAEILACTKELACTLKTAEAYHEYGQHLFKCCTDEDFPAALDLSLAAITTAIETGPPTFQYYTDLMNVSHLLHRLPEAIAAGKKALELRPNYSYAQDLVACLQWEQVISKLR